MLSAPINVTAAGDNVIVSGPPGNIIRVVGYVLSAAGHNLLSWYSGPSSGGVLLGGAALAVVSADEGLFGLPAALVVPHAPLSLWGWQGWFETRPGEALTLCLSDPQLVLGHVSYVVVSANNAQL